MKKRQFFANTKRIYNILFYQQLWFLSLKIVLWNRTGDESTPLSVRSFRVEMPRGSFPCFILFVSLEIELFLQFFGDLVLPWWLFVDTPPYYLPLPGVKPWHFWNRWWMRKCKWTRLRTTLSLSRAERGRSGDVPWTYWNRWWRKTFQEQLWPTIACSRQIWSGSKQKSCWKIYRKFCRSASSRTIVSWMSMAKAGAGNQPCFQR